MIGDKSASGGFFIDPVTLIAKRYFCVICKAISYCTPRRTAAVVIRAVSWRLDARKDPEDVRYSEICIFAAIAFLCCLIR